MTHPSASNKAVVSLLLVVAIITVAGTMASIDSLGIFSNSHLSLTGANIVTFNQTKILLEDFKVSLGEGHVTPNTNVAEIYFTEENKIETHNWETNDAIDITMRVTNNEDRPVTLIADLNQIYSSDEWFCGQACDNPSLIDIRVSDTSIAGENSCNGVKSKYSFTHPLANSHTKNKVILCEEFLSRPGANQLEVAFMFRIPQNASLGSKILPISITGE